MALIIGFDLTKYSKEELPENIATIEHIYTKFEAARQDHSRNHGLNVLACYKCNHDRGRKSEIKYTGR